MHPQYIRPTNLVRATASKPGLVTRIPYSDTPPETAQAMRESRLLSVPQGRPIQSGEVIPTHPSCAMPGLRFCPFNMSSSVGTYRRGLGSLPHHLRHTAYGSLYSMKLVRWARAARGFVVVLLPYSFHRRMANERRARMRTFRVY